MRTRLLTVVDLTSMMAYILHSRCKHAQVPCIRDWREFRILFSPRPQYFLCSQSAFPRAFARKHRVREARDPTMDTTEKMAAQDRAGLPWKDNPAPRQATLPQLADASRPPRAGREPKALASCRRVRIAPSSNDDVDEESFKRAQQSSQNRQRSCAWQSHRPHTLR